MTILKISKKFPEKHTYGWVLFKIMFEGYIFATLVEQL